MAQERFYDILIKELEVEIRREIESEYPFQTHTQERTPTPSPHFYQQTSLDIAPKFFKNKNNAYRTTAKKPVQKPVQKPAQKLERRLEREMTAPERGYYELFVKLGGSLLENFSGKELKREFRKLAYAYHPDRQISLNASELKISQARFSEAKLCYDQLVKTLEK